MKREEYWSTKPKIAQYHAITFEHPAFTDGPVRLVANQFEDIMLGTHFYIAAPMQIKPPEQSSKDLAKMIISFPRTVVGREFKKRLLQIQASGLRSPISIKYDIYLGDVNFPQMSWIFYASDKGGVNFGREFVQVTASEDNPMRLSASEIYDPEVFTGLRLL